MNYSANLHFNAIKLSRFKTSRKDLKNIFFYIIPVQIANEIEAFQSQDHAIALLWRNVTPLIFLFRYIIYILYILGYWNIYILGDTWRGTPLEVGHPCHNQGWIEFWNWTHLSVEIHQYQYQYQYRKKIIIDNHSATSLVWEKKKI